MAVTIEPRTVPRVLLSRDIGANAVRDSVALGLVAVSRGVFVEPLQDAAPWQTADHIAMANIAATARRLTNGAVVSHVSAALVHGLWVLNTEERAHVTQRTRVGRNTPSLRRHCSPLPEGDVTEVSGITVTTIERTVVDCAKSLHPREALVIADSGMRLLVGLNRPRRPVVPATVADVRARLLAMVEQGPHHGRRQARAVIARADPSSESPYETVVRWIAVSRGFPPPQLQARFDVDGRTYYVDMCWRFKTMRDGVCVRRVVLLVEYDGEIKYRAGGVLGHDASPSDVSDVVVAEKRREDELRRVPHTTVVRVDRKDTRDPEGLFRRLCAPLPATAVARLCPVPELLGPPGIARGTNRRP